MSTDNWGREIMSAMHKELPDKGEHLLSLPFLNFLDEFAKEMPKLLKDGIASKQTQTSDKWKNQLSRELDDMRKRVPDPSRTSEKVSQGGLAFQKRLVGEAGALIQALAKLTPIGTHASRIIEMTIAFEKKSEELDDAWDEICDDMDDMDKDLDETIGDIQETVDKAVEDAANRYKTVYEYGLKVAEYIRKAPGPINPASLLGQYSVFATMVANLADTPGAVMMAKKQLWERMGKIEGELGKRGVGIVMFGEIREATEEFLKAVNIDESAESLQAANECVKQAVSTGKTAGQKNDLEALGKSLVDILEDAHQSLCSAHDRFVSSYRDVFFGGISTKTFATIMNEERFKRPMKDVRISRWNQTLRKLYEFDYVPVLLKHHSGTTKETLKDYLTDKFDELFQKIKQEARDLERAGVKLEDLMKDMEKLKDSVD